MRWQIKKKGIYVTLLYRLSVALLFLSLSRLLFYLFNLQYFSGMSTAEFLLAFAGGIRFDITALIIINSLYMFMMTLPFPFRQKRYWQLPANIIYYVSNILALALNAVDSVYFRFTAKRMTADIFSFMDTGEEDVLSLVPNFIYDFAPEFLSWVGLSILFILIASRWRVKAKPVHQGLKFYLISILLFLITGFVSIIGIRGGFQLRPITVINAGSYASARNVSLVLNTPFSIIKTFGHTGLKELRYFDDEGEAEAIFNPVHYPAKADSGNQFKPINVVLIIMESFGTEYIGALNEHSNGISYTPYLDTIINKSVCFQAYANGKQSMEAVPAIVAGLPSLITRPYITSAYGSNQLNSIASLLADKGYITSFFHGGRNGTMGFESFVKIAGYDAYYGKDQYGDNDDFDGNWGIYDDAFFDFFLRNLNETTQPFFATFFSLSSHHPYVVPERLKGKFSKGTLDIHESVMYADYSLGTFLNKAKETSWFDNTLFVITADHTSLSYDRHFQTRDGIYAVPLVFYMPGRLLPELKNEIAQQADILPSVMGILDYDNTFVAFGNDLFDPNAERYSINYIDGTYQLIKDGWSLHFDGSHAIGLYRLGEDEPKDMKDEFPETVSRLESFIKAIIQQYNYRLIHNKLQ